jgi:hypothetical protein
MSVTQHNSLLHNSSLYKNEEFVIILCWQVQAYEWYDNAGQIAVSTSKSRCITDLQLFNCLFDNCSIV